MYIHKICSAEGYWQLVDRYMLSVDTRLQYNRRQV